MPDFRKAQLRAKQILTRHAVTDIPVDIEQLARLEGVQVERADFGDEISGVLVKDRDRAIIGVNGRHAYTRQRFTIAHELGHHLLHARRELFVDKDFIVHFRDANSSKGYDPLEIEANQFAAELLMPAEKVKEIFVEAPFDIDDEGALRKLAARFVVSPIAMTLRLSSLGLVVGA